MADDLKQTLRAVKRAGWTVTSGRGGHHVLVSPDGERVVSRSTRSGGRAHQNLLGHLKRAGLDLRPRAEQGKRRRRQPGRQS